MKLNIIAIMPNRLLFSPFEVKIFASDPFYLSLNIINQIQKETGETVFVARILVSTILDSRKEDKGFRNWKISGILRT